ncbi:LOW QUALITY PROTEIN: venom factor-like [Mixophyes fleayi]|uniref:LOW QUALITY PROTEIN: venom factor-like n=1 Tax=Mixophyes fleayi TaxID=3061075 RepID=UPI003F4E3D55
MVYRALCLILLCGLIGSYSQPQCTLITPNVLRVDSEETIVVDGHDSAFDADIIIKDFPKEKFILVQGKVSVNKYNGFLGTAKLTIPSRDLEMDPNKKQLVYVRVKSLNCYLEKIVLVSFQIGYIFIQTDKPIYNPGSTVLYRIFTTGARLQPMSKRLIIEFQTPENIIVKRIIELTSRNDIISMSYKLPEIVSLGVWTISAMFEDTMRQTYTTNFEVKEYVLPGFGVMLKTAQNYIYLKDKELRVDIRANYLNGNPVNGKAFALFGLKRGNEKKSLTYALRRLEITDGEGTAILERKDLVKYYPVERDLLQWSLYVTVTAFTDSGSDMVEAELGDIYIVTFPYKILFTKTTKYFKPGMSIDLTVFVTNPDGSPAARVPVVAEPGAARGATNEDGTVRITISTRSDMTSLKIIVKTTDAKLSNDQQASASMEFIAHMSTSGNYLKLSIVGAATLKPGENAVVNFNIRNNDPAVQNQIGHINYLILNKGTIMKAGRQERTLGQSLVNMVLPITVDFIPSFRILAYYTVTSNAGREIVADSIWIDVVDSCMGTLQLTGDKEKDNAIQVSRGFMRLKLRADHKAIVGLVAVDKGVYVCNSKYKISQSKVWDSVEMYDTGCTPGSGANTPGVFYDAGLALQTSFQMTTPYRSEPLCKVKLERRRRASDSLIQDKDKKGGDNSDYIEDDLIVSRTDFRETWFWKMEMMNERPDANGISTKTLNVFLNDAITTWEVLAVSLSESSGICVSKPHEIQVRGDFYIDLKLPYSVVRNEQVEIRAILYNSYYNPIEAKVRVSLTYNEHLCGLSTAKYKYSQYVTIKPASSVAVPFIIVPLTTGNLDVEVKAAGQFASDGVKKKLKVVQAGTRITKLLKSMTLEPEVKGIAGVQEEIISALDAKNIVPRTEVETIVTIQGNIITEKVDKSIDGFNLNHLILAPSGNGEQNMMSITSNVIVTHYLDVSGQWERVGVQRREQAIQFIRDGIIRQVAFRKPDFSYGAFTTTPSSTWLTAYVIKVFALAESLVKFEIEILSNSVKWLIQENQKSDGLFQEHAPVNLQKMVGGITTGATDLDSTLTAFVLIAMLEREDIFDRHVSNLHTSINRATTFINKHYPSLKKPYSIAITSYALAKAGSLSDTTKLMSASTDNTHWAEPGSHHLSIEATSYALLTLLKTKQYEQAGPLVRWLTEQKFYGDPSGSTQATIMMFQALAQYQIDVPRLKDLDMEVTLRQSKFQGETYRINHKTAMVARSYQTFSREDIAVTAKGKGQVTLMALAVYYASEEKKCNNFYLSVTIKDEPSAKRPDGAKSTVSITICTRFLQNQDATMSILDISMMTGYDPDINDLNELKKGVDGYIYNFEINKGIFDRETLILYMDKISHREEECLKFNLHQYFEVGLIQPASVTVYEYHTSENRCTKFYHVEEGSKLLGRICQGEVCRCAENKCFMQQQLEVVDARVRLERICNWPANYVYKATLSAVEHGDNYDTYVMTIGKVIMEGIDIFSLNEKRNFISHAKCRKALKLQKDRDYLIWGVNEDLWHTGLGFSYLISTNTWIEIWPNNTECQIPQYKELCDELIEFSEEMELFGCIR